VTGTSVDVSASLNGPAPWGQAVTIGGIEAAYDASRLGLVLGTNFTKLGVDAGTASDSSLTGTAGADVMYDAVGGNDTFIGGLGLDTAQVFVANAAGVTFGRAGDALTVSTASSGTDTLNGVEFVQALSLTGAPLKTFVVLDAFANTAAAIAAAPFGSELVKVGSLNVSLTDASAALANGMTFFGGDPVTINASATALLAKGADLGLMRAMGVDSFITTDVMSKVEYDSLVGYTGAAGSIVLPSVTITDDESGVANIAGGNVVYTFTFDTVVTNFTAADIDVTNGTKGALVASTVPAEVGKVFTLAVTPTPGFDGNMSLTVANATSGNQAVDTLINTTFALDLASDTGANTADDLTKTALSTFVVTFDTAKAESGDTIEVVKGGVVLGSVTLNGTTAAAGTVAVTLTTALTEGNTNSLTAVHRDAVGNLMTSSALAVTLDTILATPTVALATDSFGLGTTGTNADLLTNSAALTFSAAAIDVTRAYKIGVGESGTWTSSYTAPTANGAYTVQVRDTDTAGNVQSASLSFTLDNTVAAPTGALDVLSENGALVINDGYAIDGITNDSTPTLSGTAEAGSKVVVTIPSLASPITTTANGAGNWVITAASLVDGLYTATVNVTDRAGNTAAASATSFTIDTVAATLRAPVGDLQTFYNARLLSDGRTVELYFNEQLLSGNEAAIEARLSVQVAGYTVGVKAGTLAIGDSDTAVAGNDYRKVTFLLDKDVTAGLTAKINYVDPTTGDQTMGVIQDVAGNDVASGLWSSRNGSTVTNLTAATDAIKVFTGGMVGGTAADTLTYTKTTSEFLVGGAGADTVTIDVASVADNGSTWYVAAYSGANLPEGVFADTTQAVYGFTNVNTPARSVYVQAETINLGDITTGTHFTVANNVLQIADLIGQTVKIDVDVIDPTTSIKVGSGAGADRIEDVTDFILRSDTVVYTHGVSSASTGVMTSKAALLAGIEDILQVGTNANELKVTLPSASSTVTDTLVGIERLTFNTADGQSSDVALIGTTSATDNQGLNGYGSLTDAAAGTTPAAVIFVVDDVLKTLDRASLVVSIDGMFKTVGGNNLAFSLTPTVANSWVTFEGTSKVVFQAKGGEMVTVHVVGADGYTSINAAMTDAHAGDVIYISDNALTEATNYQVFKENITFIAYSSTYNNQLTLELGDIQTADRSLEIKNLFLLGDANINVNGNQHNNFIVGNRGNNIIQGGDGNDVIDTAGGADRIFGGLGNDTLVASSVRTGFTDSTVATAAVLNGGAGNDLLVNATTDAHLVRMTGGADADVFKFAGMSNDNGAVRLNAVITDLSARSNDDLDFTQILKAGAQVTAANQLTAGYSGGNLTYNFASTGNFSTSASDTHATTGAEVLSTVGLTGSVQVYMTTTSNVANALVLATPAVTNALGEVTTAANNGTTVHQDIFGSSVTSEMLKLIPMIDHNTLG
jgi:hypothetical protein